MAKKIIYRAGVIPYIIEDDKIQMMFMRPSDGKYGGDVFQLAKGKYEEGETAVEAGLREASEELGLFGGNIEQLDELGTFMGRTTVFVAQIKDKGMFGEPHFETAETKWMTPEEFQAEGRGLHKPVVKAAVRKIKKLVNLKESQFESIDLIAHEIKKERDWNDIKEQQIQEIQLIIDEIGKGFTWEQIKTETGKERSKSAPQPYEVWEYDTADPEQKMFALRDPNKPVEQSASVVVGTRLDDGYFEIQRAWTNPDNRRQGFMTQLYKTLNQRMQMSLASDITQSENMAKVWKALPLKQKIYDMKTKKFFDREEISDDELYSKKESDRYRLIIENDQERYDAESAFRQNQDLDLTRTILYEYDTYTHPDNKGKYI